MRIDEKLSLTVIDLAKFDLCSYKKNSYIKKSLSVIHKVTAHENWIKQKDNRWVCNNIDNLRKGNRFQHKPWVLAFVSGRYSIGIMCQSLRPNYIQLLIGLLNDGCMSSMGGSSNRHLRAMGRNQIIIIVSISVC